MSIKSFKHFKINEANSEKGKEIKLFRLVSVDEGESLVVNTKSPGKYYFKKEKDANTDVLKKQGEEFHIIEVITDESNIDELASEIETERHGCDCVVLKDDTKASVQKIEPFK